MLIGHGETKKSTNKIIEKFITSFREIKDIERVENIEMSLAKGDILHFLFDVILK
jgi:hypothetical protein